MNSTLLFVVGHIAHTVFILTLLYQSYRAANVWHFHMGVGFAVLYAVEFELYREVSRFLGLMPTGLDADARVRYLFCLYFVLGFFYREVIFYAEK